MISPFPLKNRPFETFPNSGEMWPEYNIHSPQAEGLVGWWLPQASLHSKLRDMIYLRNGIIQSNASLALDQEVGWYLNFTGGSSSYATVTHNAAFNFAGLAHFTISFWLNAAAGVNGFGDIFIEKFLVADGGWFIRTTGTGNNSLRFRHRTGGINYTVNTTIAVSDGTWKHIICNSDGTNLNLYINGIFDNSTASGAGSAAPSTNIGISGTAGGGALCNCQITDIRIYKRLLSAKEVYSLYAPSTRWELYQPQVPRFIMQVPVDVSLIYINKKHPSRNLSLRM